MTMNVFVVKGENVKVETVNDQDEDDPMSKATWKFGNFGKAASEVAKYTGKENSDVDINMWGGMWQTKGTLCDENKRIAIWGMTNELVFFERISEEEYFEFKNSAESADAPSCNYKIQPECQG